MQKSLFIFDQVLTDQQGHATWNTLSEAEALNVIRNFEHLMELNEDIDKTVIEREFNNPQFLSDPMNRWFYKSVVKGRWYTQKNFESKILPEFTKRKDYIKTHTILQFMNKFKYKIAYDRFYTNVISKSGFELYGFLEIMLHVSGKTHIDQAQFSFLVLTIDFGELYNELLWDEGYPVKH